MTSNPFDELKKWKITDLRNFIKQNNWKITGRSKDDIISKLKSKIDKSKIRTQMITFHPQISPKKAAKSVKTKGTQTKRLDTIEQQIQLLFTRINKIELKINYLSYNAPMMPKKKVKTKWIDEDLNSLLIAK